MLTEPVYIPNPYAENADAADILPALPLTDQGNGQQSWEKGAPASNMQPIVAGGTNFDGPSYNTILKALSQHLFWLQGGQSYAYNATFDEGAYGPYPTGSLIKSSDGFGFWYKYGNPPTISDPEDSNTGPGSWLPVNFTQPLNLGTLQGPTTLLPLQAARPLLLVQAPSAAGASLTLPNWPGAVWNLINTSTSGAAIPVYISGNSASVSLPPLGPSQAVGIINAGGQPVITYIPAAGLPYPPSMNADPNTFALRNSLGQLLATRFNQNSASNENPQIGSVFVESNGDGFLRKATIASVISQLGLALVKATDPMSQTGAGVGQVWAGKGAGVGAGAGPASVTLPPSGTWDWHGIVANISGNDTFDIAGSYPIAGISAGGTTLSYTASNGGATIIYMWAKRIS